MSARLHSGAALRWLAATGAAATATLLLTVVHANSTTAGMVFLVLVVWSATQAGFALSLYIAGLCAVAFDYYFLPPIHTLWLAGAQQWVPLLAFAASSLVVSRVAERARRQTKSAELRQHDMEQLYELSQEMMLHDDTASLVRELPRLIGRIFALEGVVLYVRDHDRFYASPAAVPAGIEAGLRTLTLGLNPTVALEADYHATPLMLGLRSLGGLAWRPPALSREISAAVAAQVATVLARAFAIEASARMEAARESERLRAALVDSLSHELRTPLTSIRAASTTLLENEGSDTLDDAARLDMVRLIDEESSRLDALIGEAMEMAEVDAHAIQVRLAPQHPRALLDQAVEESRKALAAHRVSVEVEDPDRPAWFDPHLLGRVLRHLLENAASYTQSDSRIALTSRRSGDRLEFSVQDNGPGIDSPDLPLIFEKFYRGKRGAKVRKGSGMGLAIVRAILAAHGGAIEVSNTPGSGACFRFWVPLVEKEPTRSNVTSSATQAT
jgi:two-component system, OmpR family, sensor histidine kinase KdpD